MQKMSVLISGVAIDHFGQLVTSKDDDQRPQQSTDIDEV